ncbi:MAG: hypothetical protein HZA93_20610 [Verrucomicrobia bacterium]|nr:hypothetical protein [Verrucomicrobiota bacterium]
MRINYPRRWLGIFCGGWGLWLGGCATGEVEMLATISGGKQVHVPLGRGGVAMTQEDGVQMSVATFTLTQEKKPIHIFALSDSRKRALRAIRVEDVSDDAALVLVEDTAPTLSDAGVWHRETEAIDPADPRLGWMATISNTLRVYRITVTFADGRTVELLQGALYPAGIKSAMRQALGQKY